MKTPLILICSFICLLITARTANAQFGYKIINGTITITNYTGPDAVVIPSTINGLPVNNIGNFAFAGVVFSGGQIESGITSVFIPNSITNIGYGAFRDCTNMTSVNIPDSIVSIGPEAFSRCESLASITIGTNVTTIGVDAFFGSGLTNLTIPSNVTNIGVGFPALTAINVDSNNTTYSSVAGVLFNKNQTAIIQYPIGNPATSYLIPESVTDIGYDAFESTKLTNIIFGTNISTIRDNAFLACRLTGITIPNTVTNIGDSVFAGSLLTNITFGNGVIYIGPRALADCYELTSINVAADNPAYSSIAGVLFDKSQKTLLQYPIGNPEASYVVPDSVTAIGIDYMLDAFANCTNLISVTFDAGVNTIGVDTFYGSTLSSVTIPGSVTNFYEAFEYCVYLTNATFELGLKSIDDYAFYACTSLTTITVPNSVTTIGDYAFGSCWKLAGATLPDSITTLGPSAFESSGLTSITIPNSITNFGETAFVGCTSLTNLTFADGLSSIGGLALFSSCSSLTSITIPGSVTSIGDQAFIYCAGLTNISIPASVTNISDSAFGFCSGLNGVFFQGNAPRANKNYVFYGDTNATAYYLPGTSGWGSTFDGIPAVMLNRPASAGSLQVTITPSGAVAAGAKWQVDGGVVQPGGATVFGLSAGQHTVSFNSIEGWTTPGNQIVTVGNASSTKAAGVYAVIASPVLTITTPTANQRWSNESFTVTGTVKDNVTISNVWVSLNGGGWTPATLTNGGSNWTEQVSLAPGTNTITTYAVNDSGVNSPTNTVRLVYVLTAPLTVQVNGQGTLIPNDNGVQLIIGRVYKIKATPVKGFAFSYWSGGVPMKNNPSLTFTMASNLTVIANFRDIARPVNVILSPKMNQVVTNAPAIATGKAKDNVGVTAVWFRVNGGSWLTADLTDGTNWVTPDLSPSLVSGTNTLGAYAQDATDNVSLTNTVHFQYAVP